jgi:hypothetical protein
LRGEGHRRRYVDTTRLAALIDMPVVAEVDANAENVCALDDTQVIEELRRRHPARCSGRGDVRFTQVVEIKGWHVRPCGVRLTLAEKETEARVAGREFVDNAW